jgi:HEAT repeat protein
LPVTVGLAVAVAGLLAGCGGGDPAAERIDQLRREGNTNALSQETGNPDAKIGRLAVRALARLGKDAQPQMDKALKSPSPEVREEAALAYPRVVKATSAPALADVAKTDRDPSVRAAAATALGHMRAVDEVEALLAAVEDPDQLVSQRASEAIARIMGRRYDFEGNPEERRAVIAEVRERWRREAAVLRDYYHKPAAPQSAPSSQ